MRKQIYNHIDNCNVCAETKGQTRAPAPMLDYPIPEKTWEGINLDTLELPLYEKGFKYLLVIIDCFSSQYRTRKQRQSLQLYLKK